MATADPEPGSAFGAGLGHASWSDRKVSGKLRHRSSSADGGRSRHRRGAPPGRGPTRPGRSAQPGGSAQTKTASVPWVRAQAMLSCSARSVVRRGSPCNSISTSAAGSSDPKKTSKVETNGGSAARGCSRSWLVGVAAAAVVPAIHKWPGSQARFESWWQTLARWPNGPSSRIQRTPFRCLQAQVRISRARPSETMPDCMAWWTTPAR